MVPRATYHALKRTLDVVVAAIGLLASLPVIAVAWLPIRFASRGSPIFAQTRVGVEGRLFTCYKLRTMYANTADLPTHQTEHTAITPIGFHLRKWKLDEVPQLYNVLIGDMSLVGPRPCLPNQVSLIEARERMGVYKALPGITGLAQVRGIDMSKPDALAAVDAEYVRSASFIGDLKLLLATLLGHGMGVDRVGRT